jgi:hypothetical protein
MDRPPQAGHRGRLNDARTQRGAVPPASPARRHRGRPAGTRSGQRVTGEMPCHDCRARGLPPGPEAARRGHRRSPTTPATRGPTSSACARSDPATAPSARSTACPTSQATKPSAPCLDAAGRTGTVVLKCCQPECQVANETRDADHQQPPQHQHGASRRLVRVGVAAVRRAQRPASTAGHRRGRPSVRRPRLRRTGRARVRRPPRTRAGPDALGAAGRGRGIRRTAIAGPRCARRPASSTQTALPEPKPHQCHRQPTAVVDQRRNRSSPPRVDPSGRLLNAAAPAHRCHAAPDRGNPKQHAGQVSATPLDQACSTCCRPEQRSQNEAAFTGPDPPPTTTQPRSRREYRPDLNCRNAIGIELPPEQRDTRVIIAAFALVL